jgi:hypothetical protein
MEPMQIHAACASLAVVILALGCGSNKGHDETEPGTKAATQPATDVPSDATGRTGASDIVAAQDDQAQEIAQRNEAMLARLREQERSRTSEQPSLDTADAQEPESSQSTALANVSPDEDVPEEAAPRSSMEEFKARVAEFEPRMGEISKTADLLDDNYRRYIDACYQKYTTAESSGSFSGRARERSQGAAAGRDWFVVYGAETDMTFGGSYSENTVVSNETTAYCRELWSDIVNGSREVNQSMKALQQEARRKGVLPGHLRDLRRRFRLDWEGWTR